MTQLATRPPGRRRWYPGTAFAVAAGITLTAAIVVIALPVRKTPRGTGAAT